MIVIYLPGSGGICDSLYSSRSQLLFHEWEPTHPLAISHSHFGSRHPAFHGRPFLVIGASDNDSDLEDTLDLQGSDDDKEEEDLKPLGGSPPPPSVPVTAKAKANVASTRRT